MLFDLNRFLQGLSYAIDCVESELLGSSTHHGKRVAYLSLRLAKAAGLTEEEQFDIAAFGILHDNGLAQETLTKADLDRSRLCQAEDLPAHCTIGENNIAHFPFRSHSRDIVKYHHEWWDGSGFFGLKGDEIPLMAQIVGLADSVDVRFRFENPDPSNRQRIRDHIIAQSGLAFSPELVALFEQVSQTTAFWLDLHNSHIQQSLDRWMPSHTVEMSWEEILKVSRVFSQIIDSKSRFTQRHSGGLEEKAGRMANHYDMPHDEMMQLRIAAALHDVGKLAIPNAILDKPSKLTETERMKVQEHTYFTRLCLEPIPGFETITEWAANHHEKLSGNGYPMALPPERLDFNARLLTVLDIYQALTEERPYRQGNTHEDAMVIIDKLKEGGQLDATIVDAVRTTLADAPAS
uniref:Putative metal dependent phosphohydrolase. Containing HD-GYP domain n=1 Tax=Magnetococcus massalia (strain MO-1) TaxID=451514 RepID=A0A1S7LHK9_MAGMO|nr:Putative metal dependent phosphohydrolase. Containing HD-GYP domain [Candidatus Magnetococcus massalia]